ncbi:MAG: DegV family protein [Christensenellales bacterium]
MKIAISAETAIDLPKEMLKKYDIKTIPFGINFNEKLVQDREGISQEIFDYVERTKVLPKTSAVSPEQFKEYFSNLLKEYDAIIHISLGSDLSSTYNNARLVVEEMKNVYVVDSKNLSTGIALLAISARDFADEGKTPDEIYNMTTALVEKLKVSFVLERLNYLYKGGRCNALTLFGANLLKIKPEIVVDNGRMVVGKKYRGHINKVAEQYCDDLIASYPNPRKKYVFVTHSSSMPEAEKSLVEKLKYAGFENIFNTTAGGTICSHCGPDTIGILFIDN